MSEPDNLDSERFEENEALSVRPPWPDELPRVRKFFPKIDQNTYPLAPRLLLAEAPERIVGVGLVEFRSEVEAHLHFRLRPRYMGSSAAQMLLSSLKAEAQTRGAKSLDLQLPPGDARAEMARLAGFTLRPVEEEEQIQVWHFSLDA
ncbi:MAG: GNAT family N-acetyltransferase [Verrucomicrobiota bacterium JB022]|nr:GNAT family N-acetyltransferase [Verrucomicrobiota bacterium JB022]